MSLKQSTQPLQPQGRTLEGGTKTAIRAAQDMMTRKRADGLAALNTLFRSGAPPRPYPDGRFYGEFLAVEIAPGLSQLGELLFMSGRSWRGKVFNAYCQEGENIFANRFFPWLQLLGPLYRQHHPDGPETYRAYTFHLSIGPGRQDPDRKVLKIDYNIPANPVFTVRRLCDELVQLDSRVYLGKAHFHWWWGRWQMVAYFMIEKSLGEEL